MLRGRAVWTGRAVAEYIEEVRAAVTQSTDAKSIDSSLQDILDLEPEAFKQVLNTIAPATLVSLVLRGYELPDAQTRLESNKALLQIADRFKSIDAKNGTTEQFWLIVAQQQEILSEHLENDLEALQDSALDPGTTQKQARVLAATHRLIRTHASAAVNSLFSVQDLSVAQGLA